MTSNESSHRRLLDLALARCEEEVDHGANKSDDRREKERRVVTSRSIDQPSGDVHADDSRHRAGSIRETPDHVGVSRSDIEAVEAKPDRQSASVPDAPHMSNMADAGDAAV